jgi:4-amino-4-deoxy-L-arabinose transferase-like glycosyltransferase
MMSRESLRDPGLIREVLTVSALTIVGAGLRLWSLPWLGLVHFDEGIYALAGLWPFSPRGYPAIDPATIAYSPPGFPVLVGLSYLCLGPSDLSAILVSIFWGAATIPVSGWLAGRTFGRGAGAAAAALAALAGPHVAFSRMALSDASFLFFWLIALGQGQRFLERPGWLRALALGVSVALAQLFKYNGWISGLIVALCAGLGEFAPAAQHPKRRFSIWGWGLAAAFVAAALYWPYYQFVNAHGGYGALLAHQRGYLGGMSSWLPHLGLQLAASRLLSGGPVWLLAGGLAAALATLFTSIRTAPDRPAGWRVAVVLLVATGLFAVFDLRWMVPPIYVGLSLAIREKRQCVALRLLAVGWLTLGVLTPFYHPYARLWLPLEAFGWLFVAGLYAALASLQAARPLAGTAERTRLGHLPWLGVLCVGTGALLARPGWSGKAAVPGILDPSDSLRVACRLVAHELPETLPSVHLFGRPAAAFYLSLSGRAGVSRLGGYDQLLRPADPADRALLDTVLLRQEGILEPALKRLDQGWVVLHSFPSRLNLPTLLDIDPASAVGGPIDDQAPLLLLRPRRAGEEP